MKTPRSPYTSVPKALAYLLPATLVYASFVLVPVCMTISTSFFDWNGLSGRVYVGLRNYLELAGDPRFFGALKNNFFLVIFLLVVPGCIGLFLATVVEASKNKRAKIFELVFFMPQILSLVVVSVIWKWIYNPGTGLLEALLKAAGLESLSRGWLGDSATALTAIGLTGSWVNFGFAFVVFLSGYKRIPLSLYEAGDMDGVTRFQKFHRISLPLLTKEIGVVTSFLFISTLKTFDLVYVMTKGGPGNSTEVLSLYVFKNAFQFNRIGYASALAVTLAILIFLLAFLLSRLSRSGEDYEIA